VGNLRHDREAGYDLVAELVSVLTNSLFFRKYTPGHDY
jgi:hypothetical protein